MDNFFNLQAVLSADLGAKWLDCSILNRYYRLSARTRAFLERLSENVSGHLGAQIELKSNLSRYDAEEELSNFFSSGCIAVQFKMEQESIVLLLSYETTYELASIISGKKNRQILTPVTNSELVAVGYYLAKILGETHLFGGKLIYLVSVTAYNLSNEDAQKFKALLSSKLKEKKCFIEYFNLALHQQERMLMVFLSSKLARQFLEESMSYVPSNYMYDFLKNKRFNCELDFKLNNVNLANIGVGNKFLLPISELAKEQGRLRCGEFGAAVMLKESSNFDRLSIQVM